MSEVPLYLHLLVEVSANELEREDPHAREEGPPWGPRHSPTVGPMGERCFL